MSTGGAATKAIKKQALETGKNNVFLFAYVLNITRYKYFVNLCNENIDKAH